MDWKDEATCRNLPLSLFFENYEQCSEIAKEVDSLCGICPVRNECLQMGVETAGTGVHGGIYLVLGHYSKLRNKHKSEENIEESKARVKNARK